MNGEADAKKKERVIRGDANVIREFDELSERHEKQKSKTDETDDHAEHREKRPPFAATGDADSEHDRKKMQNSPQ